MHSPTSQALKADQNIQHIGFETLSDMMPGIVISEGRRPGEVSTVSELSALEQLPNHSKEKGSPCRQQASLMEWRRQRHNFRNAKADGTSVTKKIAQRSSAMGEAAPEFSS